jgi:predicted double-glycine peptidase
MKTPAILLVLLTLAGCGAAATRPTTPVAQARPAALAVEGDRHMLRGVPDVMQHNNYTCGVASAQCVLQYYGQWGYQDEMGKAMGTTSAQGTHPVHITQYLTKQGLDAKIVEGMSLGDLEKVVDEGALTIIDYQAYRDKPSIDYATDWEDGHYSVVVGYDKSKIYIEDPSMLGSVGFLGREELETRWRDYELENGKRRPYVRMGIVVHGKPVPQPAFTHID